MTETQTCGAIGAMGRNVPRPAGVEPLEAIYKDHYRLVRWVARARGVEESALDDVVHEVFLVIHRRLPERDQEVPMQAWVAGVARNVVFSRRRADARRIKRLQAIPDPPSPLSAHSTLR